MNEDSLVLVHALSEGQITQLAAMYRSEWWTSERTLEETRRGVAHSSMVFGLVDGTGGLQAFARVLTDYTFKALICDVIVLPETRGSGLGRRIMRHIQDHPQLSTVKHFELYCKPEMVPYYEGLGFSAELDGICLMRRKV